MLCFSLQHGVGVLLHSTTLCFHCRSEETSQVIHSSASQFLSSLQKACNDLRAAIMLPLHYGFLEQLQFVCSSLTVHASLILDETFHSPPDILQPLHICLDLGTQTWIQASKYVLLFFINFPSRQILGYMMRLLFISWHLKHGSLALGTYTLADVHVHMYCCIFSIGKKLLLLS